MLTMIMILSSMNGMSITELSEPIVAQKLEEHNGDLTAAVNAHFSEGDRNMTTSTRDGPLVAPQEDVMDIDDPLHTALPRPPSFLSSAGNLKPFSLLDPTIDRSVLNMHPHSRDRAPFVTHPREVREIPIEIKDGS